MFVVGCGVFDKGVSKTKDTASPKLRLPAPTNIDKAPPTDPIPKPSAFGATTGRPDYGNASPIGSPPRGTNPAVMIPTPGPASPSVYSPTPAAPIVVSPAAPAPTIPTPPAMPIQGTGANYQPTSPSMPTPPVSIGVPSVGPMPPTVSVGVPPALPNP